jgi:hypothetical protein
MMQDEYKSALLWYKDDRKQLRTKPTKEKSIKTESSFFKKLKASLKTEGKLKQKQKEKPKKKSLALLKRPKEKTIKPLVPIEDTTKEKILAKIRREQEKQLRKLQ